MGKPGFNPQAGNNLLIFQLSIWEKKKEQFSKRKPEITLLMKLESEHPGKGRFWDLHLDEIQTGLGYKIKRVIPIHVIFDHCEPKVIVFA